MWSTTIWAGIITLCLLLILSILYCVKLHLGRKRYWPVRGFPLAYGSEAFGTVWQNLRKQPTILDLFQRIYLYGKHQLRVPYVGFIFAKPSLCIIDLDMVKQILVKDFQYFQERNQTSIMKCVDPLFANMLFNMDAEPWRELRPKMSPTFTTGKIKRMFQIFETSSTKLVEYLEKEVSQANRSSGGGSGGDGGGVLNLLDPYERYTMDVIASSAFGLDAQTFNEVDPIFRKMGKKLQLDSSVRLIIVTLLTLFMPSVAKALKLGFTDKEMENFFTNVILSAIKQRESTGEKRNDFLQLMLEVRNGQLKVEEDKDEINSFHARESANLPQQGSHNKLLTDEVLVAQSALFILAGFDTTQSLLLFAAYELALNPEIQDQLAAELESSWNGQGGKFTYETINHLEFLDKVVNEALRKYPPVPNLERKAMNDYKIPNSEHIIPKGTPILIPMFAIHYDEEHFPNPTKFDPERFNPENKAARHPYAFQAFGHGPRNCIGMRFALTSSKMAIATLVHNFIFEPCEKTLIPMKFAKTNSLKPEGGMHLKLRKRREK